MFSYIEPDFIEKFYWESVFFFQIWVKIEMMQNKSRLSGDHFETEKDLFYFVLFSYFIYLFIYLSIYVFIYFVFAELWFLIPYIYGANFIAKFRWESGGVPWNPLGHQRE